MEELKPCPFCGSHMVEVESSMDSTFEHAYRCTCTTCFACGSICETRNGAIEDWNHRAVDVDELLRIVEELEMEFFLPDETYYATLSIDEVLKFEREMAKRIRKAVGE